MGAIPKRKRQSSISTGNEGPSFFDGIEEAVEIETAFYEARIAFGSLLKGPTQYVYADPIFLGNKREFRVLSEPMIRSHKRRLSVVELVIDPLQLVLNELCDNKEELPNLYTVAHCTDVVFDSRLSRLTRTNETSMHTDRTGLDWRRHDYMLPLPNERGTVGDTIDVYRGRRYEYEVIGARHPETAEQLNCLSYLASCAMNIQHSDRQQVKIIDTFGGMRY